jgi:dolichol-phosphate mannosyltransferase
VVAGLDVSYEIIYADDGSTDGTNKELHAVARDDHVRIVALSRNFGKEVALTAGIHAARGEALLMIDGDGQHPVELIPEFLKRWRAGAKVIVGVRTQNAKEGSVKRLGSKLFYKIMRRVAGVSIVPGSSDYRMIDQRVQQEFVRVTERNRITRGIVDWLGYQQDYIYFKAHAREHGEAQYSIRKLVRLAIDSFISHSVSPLYALAYVGAAVLLGSLVMGLGMGVNLILHDPIGLKATGTAYGLVVVLFLVGILLVSQGIIGLYLSHIHAETQNRPLYIVNEEASVRL